MGKIALGRGLEALIPTGSGDVEPGSELAAIELRRIAPNALQPRRTFDPDRLAELAESFKSHGILQPIIVKRDRSDFLLVAGERRFRAARLAGFETMPAIIMDDLSDSDMLQIALIENLQRQDLNPIETATAYRKLIDDCNLTQDQLSRKVGKNRASVANTLRLLSLPENIKTLISEGRLTEGHARAILSVSDSTMRNRIAQRIVSETLSVRQAETLSRSTKKRRLTVKRRSPEIEDAETFLKRTLGTAVNIVPGLKKSRIEIEYYSNEDLNRILDLMRKIA